MFSVSSIKKLLKSCCMCKDGKDKSGIIAVNENKRDAQRLRPTLEVDV